MKKTFLMLLVGMLFMVAYTVFFQEEIRENPKKSSRVIQKSEIPTDFIPQDIQVVLVGDSLTAGVGDQTNKGGYLSYLKELLESEKWINQAEIQNFGVKGHRTSQLLDRLEKDEVKSALKEADLVIITIGGNDIMKVVKDHLLNLDFADFEKAKPAYEKNLNDTLSKIRSANQHSYIVLVGLYNPFSIALSEIQEINQVINEWNIASQEIISKDNQAIFVDIADLFFENIENLLHTDLFHPNNEGYKLIAERVYAQLNKEVLDDLPELLLIANKEEQDD